MGETSQMMLDGTLCEGCGVYLGGNQYGLPLLCRTCAKDRQSGGSHVAPLGSFWQDRGKEKPTAHALKARCPTCSKVIKVAGMQDHIRAVHQHQPGQGRAINT